MTEDDALRHVGRLVPRETIEKLGDYVALLLAETTMQNLISRGTVTSVWSRHILDSLQLVALGSPDGTWIDIGSGAGLPGLVIGIATGRPTILIEPRPLRATFLATVKDRLTLNNVTIQVQKAANVRCDAAATISARAVAIPDRIFAMARHLAGPSTRWVLPRGRSADAEMAAARDLWHMDWTTIPSITDPDAAIVVATNVSPRRHR